MTRVSNQWRSRQHPIARSLLACAVSSLLGISSAYASDKTVNAVIAEQAKAEQAAKATQQRIATIDEETSKLLAEYRQILSETRSLQIYNTQFEDQVKSQTDELQGIDRQLLEIETTAREVIPMMQKMLTTLEQLVELDIPFLLTERRNRVNNLKDIVKRADVSLSEKYRRILEAYGVEMEYGRTIESYRDEMDQGDGVRTVDFLRVGRVALMFQSLDGEMTGYWNEQDKRWVIDRAYQRSVRQGLRVANKQAAPDLLIVPVSAPQEVKL